MSETDILKFGLREAVPPDAPAAWGARLIYPDDVVWDRTDAIGSDEARRELLEYLRSEVRDLPLKKARELHDRGELRPSGEEDVTLYEDDHVKMVANPRGGSGYLYVAAWLKPSVACGASRARGRDHDGDTPSSGPDDATDRAGSTTLSGEAAGTGHCTWTNVGTRYSTGTGVGRGASSRHAWGRRWAKA